METNWIEHNVRTVACRVAIVCALGAPWILMALSLHTAGIIGSGMMWLLILGGAFLFGPALGAVIAFGLLDMGRQILRRQQPAKTK